jgi:3',5'-cyclic AMP phosphodiesterase CpdA
MRIVCIGDTHGKHAELDVPAGDLLVHAGDLTEDGSLEELREALDWLAGLPHRHKVAVAGNHDFALEQQPELARRLIPAGVTYLEGDAVTVEGVRIWGGPWTPLPGRWAFQASVEAMRAHWAAIPTDVDVLVTHTPAARVLDAMERGGKMGCEQLTERLAALPAVALHVHGHIHEARGTATRPSGTRVVNAACALRSLVEPLRPAIVVDLPATAITRAAASSRR